MVSRYSESLGYVVADHQEPAVHRDKTVLTYYLPFTGAGHSGDPGASAVPGDHGIPSGAATAARTGFII